jgi:hypothetical protein
MSFVTAFNRNPKPKPTLRLNSELEEVPEAKTTNGKNYHEIGKICTVCPCVSLKSLN